MVATRQTERFGGCSREQHVSLGRAVHAISAPGIRRRHRWRAVKVDEPEAVPVGSDPDGLVDPHHPCCKHSADGQDLGEIREGRRHDGRLGPSQVGVELVELGEGAVEVRARPGHVVHPDAYGDEVGTHGQCRTKLSVDDVADPPAAHREVGVGESGVMRVDDRSQPIGESDEPGRIVAVPQPLGLAVADRDISGVNRHESRL